MHSQRSYNSPSGLDWLARQQWETWHPMWTIPGNGCVRVSQVSVLGRGSLPKPPLTRSSRPDKGWLLVFDNVDIPDILNQFWPACDHGSILITTQDRKIVHRAQSAVCLKTLDDREASQLLLQYLPKEISTVETSAELAKAISQEVQGLPLELVRMAGFMVDSCTTLSDALDDLRNNVDQVCDSATFQYGKPARSAFDVSLKSLSPASLSVLRTLSMLAPDSIPENLLLGPLEDPSLRFEGYMDIPR